MKSLNYERSDFNTNDDGGECNEKHLKKYLERSVKQREIFENEIVAEKSLSEIMAGK